MHILGFFHMHTTLRRDDFVTIVWDNIKPESYVLLKTLKINTLVWNFKDRKLWSVWRRGYITGYK